MSDTKEVLLSRTGQDFLDPDEVGSAIQYRMSVEERINDNGTGWSSFNATISLSDCSRWITWDLEGDNAEAKLDRAIRLLTAAKIDLRRANKVYEASKKRTDAMKAKK